jgi:hypothetical protein
MELFLEDWGVFELKLFEEFVESSKNWGIIVFFYLGGYILHLNIKQRYFQLFHRLQN